MLDDKGDKILLEITPISHKAIQIFAISNLCTKRHISPPNANIVSGSARPVTLNPGISVFE